MAQVPKGVWKLIDESDFIIKGKISTIDTLSSEDHKHYKLKCNSAEVEVQKILKGSIEYAKINLFYYTTGGSHVHPANPELEEDYLLFLKYDEEKNAYILPSKRFSLVDITQENENNIIDMIHTILSDSISDQCEYFDLLMSNLNQPIFPINRDLSNFTMHYDSLEKRFCIDSLDKEFLFGIFKETGNLHILPFLREYDVDKIDDVLLEQILAQVNFIENSREKDCMVENLSVISRLSKLSYLSEETHQKIDSIHFHSYIWLDENEQFINQVNQILKKYEK